MSLYDFFNQTNASQSFRTFHSMFGSLDGVALNVISFRVELLFEVERLMILKYSQKSAEPMWMESSFK